MSRCFSSAYRLDRAVSCKLGVRRFVGLVLLTIWFGLTGCGRSDAEDTANEPSRKEHLVQQDEFVHFTLSGTEFKIPKTYAAGGAEQYGRLTDAKLHALLPEFVGHEPEKNGVEFRYEFSRRPGWGRKLYVKLTERGRNAAYPFFLIREYNESVYSLLYGREGVYDEIRYGLEYYRGNDKGTSRDDYYIYRPGKHPLILIMCTVNVPSPGCIFHWSYNQRLNGEMDFGMQYLPKWHEIWSKANSLLENGTTSGFEEAAWQTRVTRAFTKDYYQWTATLPDFQPCRPKDCPDRFKVRGEPPGYDHRLYVRIRPRSQNAKSLPELWRKSYENRTGHFISVGDQYDEIRYGLEFHRGKAMGLKNADMMRSPFDEAFHDDIYIKQSTAGPEVIFRCYAEKNKYMKRPTTVHEGCVGQWALPSNDIMYAAFARQYLPMWQEIMAWASSQGMRMQHATSNQRQGK